MSEIRWYSICANIAKSSNVFCQRMLKLLMEIEIIPEVELEYQWLCTHDREEALNKNYRNKLAELEKNSLPEIDNNDHKYLDYLQNHLNAMMHSVKKEEIVFNLISNKDPDKITNICSNIKKISTVDTELKLDEQLINLAKETDNSLRDLVFSAHTTMAQVEQKVTGDIISETLQSMGYRLKKGKNILAGSSKDATIRAEIQETGKIVIDTTSFSGLSCQKESLRLESELKSQGMVLTVQLNALKGKNKKSILRNPFPSLKVPKSIVQKSRNNKVRPKKNAYRD